MNDKRFGGDLCTFLLGRGKCAVVARLIIAGQITLQIGGITDGGGYFGSQNRPESCKLSCWITAHYRIITQPIHFHLPASVINFTDSATPPHSHVPKVTLDNVPFTELSLSMSFKWND